MKVIVGQETYLMHWQTKEFYPKQGKNTGLKLKATSCIIRKIDEDEIPVTVAEGHVSQCSTDHEDMVAARRFSFVQAIKGFSRPIRAALGHEYQKTCRVTPRSYGVRNRQLKNQVSTLTQRIKQLESMV